MPTNCTYVSNYQWMHERALYHLRDLPYTCVGLKWPLSNAFERNSLVISYITPTKLADPTVEIG